MEEVSHYAVGIDIGSSTIRCVVASIDGANSQTIVGFNSAPNNGMRKGVIVNLAGPAKAIDDVLGEAERMSGFEINDAVMSINGSHIISVKTDGMIAASGIDHEINEEDLGRVDEVATTGKIPANREVLDLIPYSYRLDGQGNIKDPIGMVGTRLEIKANVISALAPYCQNVRKSAEMAQVRVEKLVVPCVAAAKAVLNERQLENGVAVIDFGATTTGIAIFEEGDLQHVSVIPVGSNNITNDLAMGLKIDPEVAEELKKHHISATMANMGDVIQLKWNKENLSFSKDDVEEIVDARLDETFDSIRKELKKAGYDRKLPEGIVLVGGGSKLKGLAEYAKDKLELAVKIGAPSNLAGMGESVENPEYAVAVGLMMSACENVVVSDKKKKKSGKTGPGMFKRIMSKLKA